MTDATTKADIGSAVRAMYTSMHGWLEGTLQGMNSEQLHWQPGGRAVPAGAHYAHHLFGAEDCMINMMIRGTTPLAMGEWQGRAGWSEMHPLNGPWDEWARHVQLDLPALQAYAQAVYANTDAYLATMTPEEWARPLDLTPVGMGHQTVGFLLTIILLDGAAHCGEISAIKGLQGLQGYPF